MALLRTQLLNMNGPAPTGFWAKPAGSFWIAVGEPMNPMGTIELGNTPLLAFSVIFNVVASTTSICWIDDTKAAFWAFVAGSPMRAKLNFTAAASYGVPSLNLMLGRSFNVQTKPSGDVSEVAGRGGDAPPRAAKKQGAGRGGPPAPPPPPPPP